jgi:hypothetical protein
MIVSFVTSASSLPNRFLCFALFRRCTCLPAFAPNVSLATWIASIRHSFVSRQNVTSLAHFPLLGRIIALSFGNYLYKTSRTLFGSILFSVPCVNNCRCPLDSKRKMRVVRYTHSITCFPGSFHLVSRRRRDGIGESNSDVCPTTQSLRHTHRSNNFSDCSFRPKMGQFRDNILRPSWFPNRLPLWDFSFSIIQVLSSRPFTPLITKTLRHSGRNLHWCNLYDRREFSPWTGRGGFISLFFLIIWP